MSGPTGQTFGKYQLLDRLAMGGMAEIFRAKLVGAAGFSKDLVIKRIHADLCEDQEFVQMFINEAKLAAMLSHPNIAQVTDFDRVDDIYYLAMEWVEGVDLKRLNTRSRNHKRLLPYELSLYIIAQALKGLSYAHEYVHQGECLHIVHRDISPHNILLSHKGEVKVADFGIAKMAQSAKRTATGVLKGKVSYMAPEQTHTSQVDQRADIFAMSIVLWELLTQHRLFDGDNDLIVLDKVRESKVIPPHELTPDLPKEISDIVMKGLAKDPSHRFQNARDYYRALLPYIPRHIHEETLQQYMEEVSTKHTPQPLSTPAKEGTSQLDGWAPPKPQEVSSAQAPRRRETAQLQDWAPPAPSQSAERHTKANVQDVSAAPVVSTSEASRQTQQGLAPDAAALQTTHHQPEWLLDTTSMSIDDYKAAEPSSQYGQHRAQEHAPTEFQTPDPETLATVQMKPSDYLAAAPEYAQHDSPHAPTEWHHTPPAHSLPTSTPPSYDIEQTSQMSLQGITMGPISTTDSVDTVAVNPSQTLTAHSKKPAMRSTWMLFLIPIVIGLLAAGAIVFFGR